MAIDNYATWLTKFSRLRIDTASNAPHKPLLLLVVLDLAQEGLLGPVQDPLSLRTRKRVPGAEVRALGSRIRPGIPHRKRHSPRGSMTRWMILST